MLCLSLFFSISLSLRINTFQFSHRERMLFHNQEMDATDFAVSEEGEDDYIDLELSSSPSRILSSSPQSREFEFQMSTAATESADTTSPADELFYKGKLLPLHLPPRLQMVQNLLLLHPTSTTTTADPFEDSSYFSSMPSTNAANTPLDISPSESCRVSCDLNTDDYFFEWSNELNTFINNHPTKITWPKKLKLIKHSILAHKLKASKAYLKSLFVKSACSHDSATRQPPPEPTYPTIAAIMNGIEENGQRRSFSSAIKRHSPTKCSSSSSSNSSSGSSSFSGNSHELHCLRRSSSATEIECSIEGAIAHCKKSQHQDN